MKPESEIMDASKAFEKLLGKYALNLKKTDKDLEWDLGLTGDDALELLLEYSQLFNVDMGEFEFQRYFHDESMNFVFMIRKIFSVRKKEKLTIDDLREGIKMGFYLEKTLPQLHGIYVITENISP